MALIVLMIAASPVAWSAGEPASGLHRMQFPGFSIELPEGEVKRKILFAPSGKYLIQPSSSFSDYLHSALQLKVPEKLSMIGVTWQAQKLRGEDLAIARKALTASFGALRSSQDLESGRWADIATYNDLFVGFGGVYCEPGLTVLIMGGVAAHEETVAKRTAQMVQSVRCEIRGPLPKLPEVDLPDPAQFGRSAMDRLELIRRDGLMVYTNVTQDNILTQPEYVERFFRNMAAAMLSAPASDVVAKTQWQAREDKAPQMLSIFNGGDPLHGAKIYISAMYCERWELTFLTLVLETPDLSGEAQKLVVTIKCPGADPQTRIELSELFGKPCRAGKLGACLRLVEYVEAGMADTAYGTADQLRARACALGDKTACSKPVKDEKNKN